MAEFPHLPMFTDAYLADTRHLTTEEHGAYLLLLMEAWRRPECCLPDDDVLLARLSGLPAQRWAEVKPVVMSFWKRDGRRKVWTQKRLSKERGYVSQKSQSQRDKATKRWDKTKKDDAAALLTPCPDDAPTPTPTKKKEAADDARASIGFIEQVCEAAGGKFGHATASGVVLGMGQDEADAVRRWQTDLGLSPSEILIEVQRQTAKRRGGPVNSLTYFTKGMKDRAGQKQAAVPLEPTPIIPTETGGQDVHSRPYVDRRQAAANEAHTRRLLTAARARPA